MSIKIIYDSDSSAKAAAYILLIFVLPVIGIIIYLSFGLKYRKSEIYNKKLILDEKQSKHISQLINTYIKETSKDFKSNFNHFFDLSSMLYSDTNSFVTKNNKVKLLINGENKFPELIQALKEAKHHIHMEYYIYDDDKIGNEIADILIQKAQEGVEVRFIYDDFGSRTIRKKLVPKLRANKVEAYSFYKVLFIFFANRLNYRNHRKIVIIDGKKAFIGGINVSDKYINLNSSEKYWRDTHLMIEGEAIWELQRIFLADWNFCSNQTLAPNKTFFREHPSLDCNKWVQIVTSGPDSKNPSIFYSILHAISESRHEILITTPYLIPCEELLHAIHMAVLRGVKVKILLPEKSDVKIVDAVSRSYFLFLLKTGVEIYLYQKGFVHAKTMVFDKKMSMVGTANLDNRSFDLNFEVNAIIYDMKMANLLIENFNKDISNSKELNLEEWKKRAKIFQLLEKSLRVVAPLL